MTKEEANKLRVLSAVHEAGHAVAFWASGFSMGAVRVYRRERKQKDGSFIGGKVLFDVDQARTARQKTAFLVAVLAGHEADILHRWPHSANDGFVFAPEVCAYEDYLLVKDRLRKRIAEEEQQEEALRRLRNRAKRVVKSNWHLIEALSSAARPIAQKSYRSRSRTGT